MEELLKPLSGVLQMLVIVCIEAIIVLIAMSVDFVAGFHKAKLRGEERTSYGLKRTVSKFILYMGSVLIGSGIDLMFYTCNFWNFIHLSALNHVPVVATIIAVFICVTEIRSVWEKAEAKHRREIIKTAEFLSKCINKDDLKTAITEALTDARKDGEV
jgi:hypothetical protein